MSSHCILLRIPHNNSSENTFSLTESDIFCTILSQGGSKMRIRPLDRRDYRTLPPVFRDGSWVRRFEQKVKNKTVILFQIERDSVPTFSHPSRQLAFGDPSKHPGKGFVLLE